jgi:hypothetical protein
MKIQPRIKTDKEILTELINRFVIKDNPYQYLSIIQDNWEILFSSDWGDRNYQLHYRPVREKSENGYWQYPYKKYKFEQIRYTPIENLLSIHTTGKWIGRGIFSVALTDQCIQ